MVYTGASEPEYTMSPETSWYGRMAERGWNPNTACGPKRTFAPGGPPKMRARRTPPPQRAA